MPDLTLTIDQKPIRWQDKWGVMHAAEGSRMVPFDRGTFILWTRCGQFDVPANAGFTSHDEVTCPECAAIESERDPDPDRLREDRDERLAMENGDA